MLSSMDVEDTSSFIKGQASRNALPEGLFELCEKAIKEEILAYFEDMTVCRMLKQYGQLQYSLVDDNYNEQIFSKSTQHHQQGFPASRKRSRSQKMLEELCAMLPGGNVNLCSSAVSSCFTYPYTVRCDSAATRIVDAIQCTVLSKQIAVLAETVLSVEVKCIGRDTKETIAKAGEEHTKMDRKSKLKSHSRAARRLGGEKGKKQAIESDGESVFPGSSAPDSHFYSIPLYSTHLVDNLRVKRVPPSSSKRTSKKRKENADAFSIAESDRRACSFSMQSVLILGKPLQLECYTHHMVHFGFLCYSVWNAPDSFFINPRGEKSKRGRKSDGMVLQNTPTDPSLLLKEIALLPSNSEDGILILGLGGNVLGTCLDACLSPNVQMDVVEIEPAMLNICVRNGLTPPLTSSLALLRHASSPSVSSPSSSFSRNNNNNNNNNDNSNNDNPPSLSSWYRRDAVPSLERSSACNNMSGPSSSSPMVLAKDPSRVPPICCSTARQSRSCSPNSMSIDSSHSCTDDRRCGCTSRTHYRFYVMDAHDFLKGEFTESPALVGEENETTAKYGSADSQANSHRMQPPPSFHFPRAAYNIIFLDCYDPDIGTMIHSTTLLSRCKERLSPGGVLLINAHVGADHETLKKLFLNEGFASVQVLKVAGCCQIVVACMVSRIPNNEPRQTKNTATGVRGMVHHEEDDEEERERQLAEERFTLPVLRRFTEYINKQQMHWSALAHQRLPLMLEPDWLTKSSLVTRASPVKTNKKKTDDTLSTCGCRVWEHRT